MSYGREDINLTENGEKQKKTEDESTFEIVLNRCISLLNDENQDIFELLDPLVTDTQCHIHSVLIIDKLLKAYDKNEEPHYNMKRLGIEDIKILSYAVLLSLLKYEEKDEFGFVVHHQLLNSSRIFTNRRKAEQRFINEIKQMFNSASTDFMKQNSSEKIKTILETCEVLLNSTRIKLKSYPHYVTVYAALQYMEKQKLPIIISLMQFNVNAEKNDLNIHRKSVLFYEFQDDQKMFRYKKHENLNEHDKNQPTIAFTCFSVINNNKNNAKHEQLLSEKILTENCDIRDVLMINFAGYLNIKSNTQINESKSKQEYMKTVFKQHSNQNIAMGSNPFEGNFRLIEENIFGCYEFHNEMSENFMVKGRYLKYVSKEEDVIVVNRTWENIFLNADHANVSSYSREYENLNRLNIHARVPLAERIDLKITEAKESIKRIFCPVLEKKNIEK